MYKRPLVIITISYIIGIIMGLYLEINIALFAFAFILIIGILYFIISKEFKSYKFFKAFKFYEFLKNFNIIIFIVAILMALFSFFIVHNKEKKFKSLYDGLESEVLAKGTVIEIQKESEYFDNYVVKISSINNNLKFKNTNVLLKVKKNKNCNMLKYGDVITFYDSFEKPSIRRNYKGFDYSQYLKTKNIYVIFKTEYNNIYTDRNSLVKDNMWVDNKVDNNSNNSNNSLVNNSKNNSIITNSTVFVSKMWINNIKNNIKKNMEILLDTKNANVANAILLGDLEDIDDDQRMIFTNASLIHILAISGMHVTYVVLFWSVVLKKADNRKTKYFLVLFLVFFANLTGCSPSIVRASMMTCIAICSKLLYRKSDTINNIAISCILILITNPYNILNLGFQLSFLGTLGIVLLNAKITNLIEKIEFIIIKKSKWLPVVSDNLCMCIILKALSKIKSIVILGISANIMIIPVLIYTSNVFSFVFLISTVLVTPILGIMIFTGYVTAILSIFSIKVAFLTSWLFNLFIIIFNFIAEFSSNISFLKMTIATPNLIVIIVYYVIVFYLLLFYRKKHRKIALKVLAFFTLVCVINKCVVGFNKGLKIYFIDVGQGDSCLIITEKNKTILIDGGGSETGSYDVGEKVLVPYLLDRNVTKIDYAVFTHFDSDHCQGLFSVMNELTVKNAIISEQGKVSENYKRFVDLTRKRKVNIIKVKARG